MKTIKNLILFALLQWGFTSVFANDTLTIEGFLSSKKIKAEKMVDGIFWRI